MNLYSHSELSSRSIFVYGTGGLARLLSEALKRRNLEIRCFVDSSSEKWTQQFEGERVASPAKVARDCREGAGLIVVASSFYAEISKTLQDLGLAEGIDFVDAVTFAVFEEFEADRTRLERYRDCHKGQRAFLIGNGPSLRMEDLDMLQGEVCFAANKIYLAYEKTNWRPTYYCCCDPQVSVNIRDRILELDTPKFLANATCFYGERLENGFVLPYFYRNRTEADREPRFSEEPVQGLYDGGTVIYMMMQLAWFMGIRELYLIGMDHSFAIPSGRKGQLLEGGGDNHFHPDYRPKEEYWSVPDFDFMNRAFEFAGVFFEERGGKIINVSRKTALEAYPKKRLEDIL